MTFGVEGWCYLGVMAFVFFGALIRDINLLMLLFGILVGPLLYSLWYGWFALRKVDVRRELPRRVHAGDLFEVTIEVASRRRWFGLWAIVVSDQITAPGREAAPREPRLMFLHLAPGKSYRLTYQTRLLDRGVYEFGPLVVSTRFPLGLARRHAVVDVRDRLVVWPRLGKLGSRSPRAVQQQTEFNSRQSHHQRGLYDGDFYGLRDWRAGDSLRWIHWRTTARRGELMVRQFERQRAPDITLLVDLWQPPRAELCQRENVELAISYAATLVRDTCRRGGHQITIAIAGRQNVFFRGPAGAVLLEQALAALATAEPTPDNRLAELLVEVMPLVGASSRTTFVTSRDEAGLRGAQKTATQGDPRARHWCSQARFVSTASAEFEENFQVT